MSEPLANIGVVHPGCAPKARPELTEGKPLESFIGKFVKYGFVGFDRRDKINRTEHTWVEVKSVVDGMFVGLLSNDPVLAHPGDFKDQSEVRIYPKLIEAIDEG